MDTAICLRAGRRLPEAGAGVGALRAAQAAVT